MLDIKKETRSTHKDAQSECETQEGAPQTSTQGGRGALHEEMRRFHLQSQNQTGSRVWGLADCFLKCKGVNVKKLANV